MHLWRSFIFRHLRQEPFRALSTLLGIAMGIAVIIAIQLAKESSVDGFRQAIDEMAGKAALEISAPGGLPEDRLVELIPLEAYGLLCPVVEGEISLGEQTLHVLGVDILLDQEVRDYELVDFGNGRTKPTPTEFLALLSDPKSIILTEKLAKRQGWKVGDEVSLGFADQYLPMRIAALLLDKGAAKAVDGNFALMDIAAAQWRLGKLGRIDRLEIKLKEGVSVDVAEKEISSKLSPGLNVSRPQRRGSEVEKMLAAYHFNLTLLSGIAFLAGLYVIYNSVALSVIGRRVEIGMLRTLGVTRKQVAWLFLLEAATMAVPGCLLGLGIGQLLGHGTVKFTQLTIATLYTQSNVLLAPLTWGIALPVVCVGVMLALVAALRPALEAAKQAPITAVRNSPNQTTGRGSVRRQTLSAAVLLLFAVVSCFLPTLNGLPVFGAVACLFAVAGVSAFTPFLLRVFLTLIRRFMVQGRSVAAQLAWGNLAAGQNRLSIPVSALGGTLALTTAIAIMVGSFRETLTYWVDNSLSADLYIRPGTKKGAGMDATFSLETFQLLKNHPAVAAVDPLRNFDIPYNGSRIILNTADFSVAISHGKLLFQGTSDWRGVLQGCIGNDAVVVSEPMALRHGIKRGGSITLPTPKGVITFQVRAVYYDYSNDRGSVTMDHRTYEKYFGPVQPTNLAVFLKANSNADEVREQMIDSIGKGKNVQIFTNVSLRGEVMRIFDRTFSITWALEAIAILVAMAGVATTVLTLVLERKDELRILRQLGAEQSQLSRTLAVEAGIIGGMSQFIGIALGFGLSVILVFVINVQSFGWTIQFHPPWSLLIQFSIVLPLATALAGWLFARRILRHAEKNSLVTISEE